LPVVIVAPHTKVWGDEKEKENMWLVMPKAEVDELSIKERMEIAEKLRDTMAKRGIRCYDIHFGNVGKFQDKPALVNYGKGLVECNLKREEPE
jgi:hypothetical protein